jgi:hypothetical protein
MPTSTSADASTLREHQQGVRECADVFTVALRRLLTQHGIKWHAPTVSYDESDNSVEISWWRANKSLIITVELDAPITFLKAWGPNIHSEMESGENPSKAQLIDLWQWLYA